MAAADPELAGAGAAATTAAATAVNVSGEEEDLTRIGPQDEAQRAQVSLLIKPKILIFESSWEKTPTAFIHAIPSIFDILSVGFLLIE